MPTVSASTPGVTTPAAPPAVITTPAIPAPAGASPSAGSNTGGMMGGMSGMMNGANSNASSTMADMQAKATTSSVSDMIAQKKYTAADAALKQVEAHQSSLSPSMQSEVTKLRAQLNAAMGTTAAPTSP